MQPNFKMEGSLRKPTIVPRIPPRTPPKQFLLGNNPQNRPPSDVRPLTKKRMFCMAATTVSVIIVIILFVLMGIFAYGFLSHNMRNTTRRKAKTTVTAVTSTNQGPTGTAATKRRKTTTTTTPRKPTKPKQPVGCTKAVQQRCTKRLSSVCFRHKCPNAHVYGPIFKKSIMLAHNRYRKSSFNGSFGADMVQLTWDDELMNAAMGWAHTLCLNDSAEYDLPECRLTRSFDSVGQNIVRYKSDYMVEKNPQEICEIILKTWDDERAYEHSSQMFPYQPNPDSVNFTQVMWSRSYRIGCAMIRSGIKLWMVCNYAPSGNIKPKIFEVYVPSREVASNCRGGSVKGPSGLCEVNDLVAYRRNVDVNAVG